MSELITLARPYAKAAFNFAIERQDLNHWHSMLAFSTFVARIEEVAKLLASAAVPEKMFKVFISISGNQLDKYGQNFIHIMAENRRLLLLPEVMKQFNALWAALESTIEIDVFSAKRLSYEQQDKIISVMEKRLLSKVKLNCKIDKSVLAGVIIHAFDMVIDGSVRGRLNRLKEILQF